jgi:Ras-related protein Rab-1A
MNFDCTYKIVVVGASSVGKTCILLRLVDRTFFSETESTIGVEYRSDILTVEQESIKLNIWDTAGQERFRAVSRTYFRAAIGAVLVFSLDSADSFEELASWLRGTVEWMIGWAIA